MSQLPFVLVAAFLFDAAACAHADPADATRSTKLAASLARAEAAWQRMADPATAGRSLADAEARYAAATTDVVDAINAPTRGISTAPAWNWQAFGSVRLQTGDFVLELARPEATGGAWPLGGFDRVETIGHPRATRAVPTRVRAAVRRCRSNSRSSRQPRGLSRTPTRSRRTRSDFRLHRVRSRL